MAIAQEPRDGFGDATTGYSYVVSLTLCLILGYFIYRAFANVFLHPLGKYPGPRIAALTQIPIAWQTYRGNLSHWIRDLHERYQSEVIRISPTELSFIDPAAWKDLYVHQKGRQHFQKDLLVYARVTGILTAPDADHRRMRRLLNHAFSDKALREQEPIIQFHVRKLISNLVACIPNESNSLGKIDLMDNCMFGIFDIISDLSFGTSFNCQETSTYHPWVRSLILNIKHTVFSSIPKRFGPTFEEILRPLLMPSDVLKAKNNHNAWAAEQTDRRLNTETVRPDFLSYIVRHNMEPEDGGMSREEIFANSSLFLSAGAETTAALIAGVMFLLLKHPAYYARAKLEIRELSKGSEDIDLQTIIDGAPFLLAVIDEGFRLYPTALAGQPRVAPPSGEFVGKNWVPGGTKVILNQLAANYSTRHFKDPMRFVPERWMGEVEWEGDVREVVQPFSVGSRNCIGKNLAVAEIRLVLAYLLNVFDFELIEETDKQWLNQKAWFTWEKKPLIVGVRKASV